MLLPLPGWRWNCHKLVIDEEGKIRNEYVQDDGSTVVGDYDVVPLIDRFVEEHPDFAYHGHKGIVALTGYNGILGYRTDISYQTRPDDLNDDKKAWLDAHPDFDLDIERAEAKKVADAMKAEAGLLPAIHGDIKTCPQFPWNALKQIHRISKRTLTLLLAEQILLSLLSEQILITAESILAMRNLNI